MASFIDNSNPSSFCERIDSKLCEILED